jgi:hypothetical protein
MLRTRFRLGCVAVLWACAACEEGAPSTKRQSAPGEGVVPRAGTASRPDDEPAPDETDAGGSASDDGGAGAAGASPNDSPDPDLGTELRISVTADAPTFVSLTAASEVDESDDWDLVFRGWDIFTNGGASGGGKGAAFGPLPFSYFLAGEEPGDVPFLIEDKAAGAFRDWYAYDGEWHALYSRFHTYGVKSGGRTFKVQLLGYYGDVAGAPISALYQLRYAEVTEASLGQIVVVENLDGTAGGLGGDDGSASGLLSLRSGERLELAPEAAAQSRLWDLSFRRDSISINGGLGGPGDVTAVDLQADETAGETLSVVKARTAESEAAAFAAVDYGALNAVSLKYRGDRVVSAFSEAWVELGSTPPRLAEDDTWLVAGADGASRFLVALTALQGVTGASPGKVIMRIQKLR